MSQTSELRPAVPSRLHRPAARDAPPRPGSPLVAALVEGPWELPHLASLSSRLAVASLGLVVSWIGSSGTTSWNAQQAWTAVGIGSVVLGMTGIVGWLRAGVAELRAFKVEQLSRRQLHRVVDAGYEPAAGRGRASGADDGVITGNGMTRYHRATCLFVAGKPTKQLHRSDARGAGLEPCAVCAP